MAGEFLDNGTSQRLGPIPCPNPGCGKRAGHYQALSLHDLKTPTHEFIHCRHCSVRYDLTPCPPPRREGDPVIHSIVYWYYQESFAPTVGHWIVAHVCPPEALEERMREAVAAFFKSRRGRCYAKSNGSNWGDAASAMELRDWTPYGIIRILHYSHPWHSLTLDHDETFDTE